MFAQDLRAFDCVSAPPRLGFHRGEYSSSCVISLQALAHIAILIMEIYGQCVLYEVFFVHAQGKGDISDDSIPTYEYLYVLRTEGVTSILPFNFFIVE